MSGAGQVRVLRGGRVVCPEQGHDAIADLVVDDGHVVALRAPGQPAPEDAEVIDVDGCWVLPGGVDLCCYARAPGREDEESLATTLRSPRKPARKSPTPNLPAAAPAARTTRTDGLDSRSSEKPDGRRPRSSRRTSPSSPSGTSPTWRDSLAQAERSRPMMKARLVTPVIFYQAICIWCPWPGNQMTSTIRPRVTPPR